jgi:hypothetical protein
MNEEVMAMNTAKLSAVKARLNSGLKQKLDVIGEPLRAGARRLNDPRKETETRTKETRFLSRLDSLPIKGRRNAPIQGTKITARIVFGLAI